ncbi:PREDICTED: NEDD8-specific protease 1 [Nicotiana attenuata]|uniref:Nedd8-specific protease 1 n=1 Tax=Nicotiana attenuata TaxID=49451 RepID=A0A314L9X0_NICAT|nr:PREDICTED: NEDD8-specific protease 1 [Nicotiana attenuata]XP_019262713.1 PREDICTED: NEDD8-specific protease 1 [Nicotiana attenuata]OIT37624.1 nedd8-specific protease 1 [Nicotiana attenuata]
MAKSKADEKILGYNDVVLRRSDLDILNGPNYLNDRIIEFYFSYLSSSFPSDVILLVPPSIAFWIKECPDPASLKDFMEPLHLSRRKLILLPINDNSDVCMAEGGSHWSLLAFERNSNVFVHHDSIYGFMNEYHAKQVYEVTLPYTASSATYKECPGTPKQVNGYDCGVYVLAIARVICQWYVSSGTQDADTLWFSHLEQVSPSAVSTMRNEILGLIKGLMAAPKSVA